MKLLFCLPGKTFSSNYFNSWNATIAELIARGISYQYVIGYDPVVYFCRNKLLGGNNILGKKQLPWQGSIQYDYMIWIDSDMVWNPSDILNLISHSMPIVSGTYLTSDSFHYPIVEQLDYNHLSDHGTFRFMNRDSMNTKSQLFEVDYTGFGFLAIQYGIIEQLEYPWFRPRWVESNNFFDFTSEDVGFCWTIKDHGYKIYVDPKIKIGHEKSIIL
jgi:GT2 family glycosyltransferase